MMVLAGLVLAPFGGLLGALTIAAISSIAEPDAVPADFLQTMIFLGATLGALFAAPTTALVLPLAGIVARKRHPLKSPIFAAAGCVSGGLTMLLLALSVRRTGEAVLPSAVLVLMLTGALSGGVCGFVFGAFVASRARASREVA